jgi:hypothetical protein
MVQACVETFDPATCPLPLLYPTPLPNNSEEEEEEEEEEATASSPSPEAPSVDLCEWINMTLDEVDPDSTSLLPHQIALIDLGDKLIVRIGRDVDTQRYGALTPLPLILLLSSSPPS